MVDLKARRMALLWVVQMVGLKARRTAHQWVVQMAHRTVMLKVGLMVGP